MQSLIFDLDQTLALHGHFYTGIVQALSELHQRYQLFLCSYNPLARQILDNAHVLQYFKEVVVVRLTQTKGEALNDLLQRRDIDRNGVLFFDNNPRNITSARAFGIPSYLVPPTGLTPALLHEQLTSFSTQKIGFRKLNASARTYLRSRPDPRR